MAQWITVAFDAKLTKVKQTLDELLGGGKNDAFLVAQYVFRFCDVRNSSALHGIVHITVPKVTVESGKTGAFVVTVKVKDGYHIQAHAVSDEYLGPATIEAQSDQGIVLEE